MAKLQAQASRPEGRRKRRPSSSFRTATKQLLSDVVSSRGLRRTNHREGRAPFRPIFRHLFLCGLQIVRASLVGISGAKALVGPLSARWGILFWLGKRREQSNLGRTRRPSLPEKRLPPAIVYRASVKIASAFGWLPRNFSKMNAI